MTRRSALPIVLLFQPCPFEEIIHVLRRGGGIEGMIEIFLRETAGDIGIGLEQSAEGDVGVLAFCG